MCVAVSLACTACRHGYSWHHGPKPASRFCATITRRKDAARLHLKCKQPATDTVCTGSATVTQNLLLHTHGHSMPAISAAIHIRHTMHSTLAVDCQDSSSLNEHCELPSSCDMACSRIKPPRLQESSGGRLHCAHTCHEHIAHDNSYMHVAWFAALQCGEHGVQCLRIASAQIFERHACMLMGSCLSCAAGPGMRCLCVYCLHATEARAWSVLGQDLTNSCAACILVSSVPDLWCTPSWFHHVMQL